MGMDGGMWLFGYGSLIWKPPPHFDKRVPGFVENYVRRFWQARQEIPGSGDNHRGTPEAPGRVVTLISRAHWETLTDKHPEAPPKTWGAAYHIPQQHVREVKEYLDIREINGYTVDMAAFHVPVYVRGSDAAGTPLVSDNEAPSDIECLVYIGLPDNPQFLGPQDPDALAAHIVRSKGPSGENKDYVYKLEEALEDLRKESGIQDEIDHHVLDLARRVRQAEKALQEEY